MPESDATSNNKYFRSFIFRAPAIVIRRLHCQHKLRVFLLCHWVLLSSPQNKLDRGFRRTNFSNLRKGWKPWSSSSIGGGAYTSFGHWRITDTPTISFGVSVFASIRLLLVQSVRCAQYHGWKQFSHKVKLNDINYK